MIRLALIAIIALLPACDEQQTEKGDAGNSASLNQTGYALSSACSGCHAIGGSALTDLTGWSESDLLTRMQFYKDDREGSTVMHRLARGYSDEELEAIAGYLASNTGGAK